MRIGYAYLLDKLATGAFELPVIATIAPVQRIIAPASRESGAVLRVPASVAPPADAADVAQGTGALLVSHLLFALKHEGLELQQAILALKKIDRESIQAAVDEQPNGEYARRAAYLWELAHPLAPPLTSRVLSTAPYKGLFDPGLHYVGVSRRGVQESKWRIDFNGLGTPLYCPSVRRTAQLDALIDANILGRARAFVESLDAVERGRILSWAYLSETRGSDQIENEPTSHDKALRFAQLLSTAGSALAFTEGDLCSIQRLALPSSPLLHAYEYRSQQNWLVNGVRGPLGVTYVPPAPPVCHEIMDQLSQIAAVQSPSKGDDARVNHPLIMSALMSFAVVMAHPFMDGNGRVHRFVFHSQLCARAGLPDGLILPVSAAMHRHERAYLAALQSFSKPARVLWDVTRVDDEVQGCTFVGDEAIYRYWDATACVSFGAQMAQEALEKDLVMEHEYLVRHDAAVKAVGSRFDFQNQDLNKLVRQVLMTGSLSNNWRKKLVAQGYSEVSIDGAQTIVQGMG